MAYPVFRVDFEGWVLERVLGVGIQTNSSFVGQVVEYLECERLDLEALICLASSEVIPAFVTYSQP